MLNRPANQQLFLNLPPNHRSPNLIPESAGLWCSIDPPDDTARELGLPQPSREKYPVRSTHRGGSIGLIGTGLSFEARSGVVWGTSGTRCRGGIWESSRTRNNFEHLGTVKGGQ